MGLVDSIVFGIVVLLLPTGVAFAMTQVLPWEYWFARGCFILAAIGIAALAVYWLWPEAGAAIRLRIVIAALVGTILLPSLILSLYWVDRREDFTSTRLYPGSNPTPTLPTGCDVTPNDLIIFLGSNVAWASRMPHTVIQMNGEAMLSVSRDNDELSIRILRIFDDRGDIIARIENGEFWVRNDVRRTRTRNTLAIYDHNDQEVLSVNFLDSKAISVLGAFRHPKIALPLVISSESLTTQGLMMSQSCFGENNVDIAVGG